MSFKQVLQNYKNVSRIGSLDLIFSMTKEGIASFLILYLIQTLNFTDTQAYGFVGLKEVISYIIPFLAAIVVSSFVGAAQGALLGMMLMGIGCFLLSVTTIEALNIGFGFFLFGYGLGKPTFPLLVAMKKGLSRDEKDCRIKYLYTFGNSAAFIAPFMMGLLGGIDKWHHSFYLLGITCILGSIFSYFTLKKENLLNKKLFHNFSFLKIISFFTLPFAFSLPFFFPILKNIFLILSATWVLVFFYKSWKIFDENEKNLFKKLILIFGSIILFFAFQTLEYTFFPVYVERFINKSILFFEIKTPWFHMVSPLLSIIASPFLIKYFKKYKDNYNIMIDKKIFFSFYSLFISFISIYLSSYFLNNSLLFVFLSYGLFFIGSFLLVPTSQEIINRFKSDHVRRSLMGILFLSMAFARLSGSFMSQHLVKKFSINEITKLVFFEESFSYLIAILLSISLFVIVLIYIKNILNKNNSFHKVIK